MAMDFKKSDPVEWEIAGKDTLILKRKKVDSAGQEKI
jgi:hypothetical protein